MSSAKDFLKSKHDKGASEVEVQAKLGEAPGGSVQQALDRALNRALDRALEASSA